MKCNLEGHRSFFLLYAPTPRLVFLHNSSYTPQTNS